MDAKKAQRKIPFCHPYVAKHCAIGIRGQIGSAEIILRRVSHVCKPGPKNRLFLLDHIFRRFVLTGHGDAVIGAGGGILRSRNFDQRGSVRGRRNFDNRVDTLCVNRDRRADECCKEEATFESIHRHCDDFIFKGSSQGGRRSNELAKAGQALILSLSCQTKPY